MFILVKGKLYEFVFSKESICLLKIFVIPLYVGRPTTRSVRQKQTKQKKKKQTTKNNQTDKETPTTANKLM